MVRVRAQHAARLGGVALGLGLSIALLGVGPLRCLGPRPTPLAAQRLAPFTARLEAVRGRSFGPPVAAYLLPPDQVGPALEAEMRRVVDPVRWAGQEALLRALGWVGPDTDLWRELVDLQASAVVGYYAVLEDRLYVVARDVRDAERALRDDPSLGRVLVHELAHAFQARRTRLLEVALGLDEHDDLAFALAALLEGDALWTEMQDAALRGGDPLPTPEAYARAFEVDVASAIPTVSPWLRALFLRPYPAGYAWVRGRVGEGGGEALDRTLREPPLSSAEILASAPTATGRWEVEADPRRFAPAPGCRPRATNAFGWVGWLSWSERADGPPPARWADRAWLFDCSEGPSWAWLIAVATPEEARTVAEAAARRPAGRAPSARSETVGARLLLSKGLSAAGRRWLLESAPLRFYPTLSDWLAAHPEVEARAAALRRAARELSALRPDPALGQQVTQTPACAEGAALHGGGSQPQLATDLCMASAFEHSGTQQVPVLGAEGGEPVSDAKAQLPAE